MLYLLALVLIALWLLGFISSYTIGGFIHILLVIAIILVLVRIITAGSFVDYHLHRQNFSPSDAAVDDGVAFDCCLDSSARGEETGTPFVRLQTHKPIYFLIGKPDTKIQLSFKVQFIHHVDFFFAYTQLVMWDIFKRSSPVREQNYDLETFYRIFVKKESERWVDLGFFEHESNGKSGAASRSWNRVYVLYHSMQKIGEHITMPWSIKAWIPYYRDPSNRNFAKYRGVWELQMTLTNFLGSFFGDNDLTLRLYPGGKYYTNPLLGGQELTLRSKTTIKALAPVVVFQLFHGYAENMLDYQRDRFGVRIGMGF